MPPKASTASTVKNKKIIKIIDDIVKTKPNLKGVALFKHVSAMLKVQRLKSKSNSLLYVRGSAVPRAPCRFCFIFFIVIFRVMCVNLLCECVA